LSQVCIVEYILHSLTDLDARAGFTMSGQWGEYESVYNYVVSKQYPKGVSKDDT